ncbi:MAG: DUF3857 domain-containing protein [Planctomycetes bacterium]|nr:DUF3857 domain-containing protein [Planctomycetota bacterium]
MPLLLPLLPDSIIKYSTPIRGRLACVLMSLPLLCTIVCSAAENNPPDAKESSQEIINEPEDWIIEETPSDIDDKEQGEAAAPPAAGFSVELEAERLECRGEALSAQNTYARAMLECAQAASESKQAEVLWARAEFNLEKALSLHSGTCQQEVLEAVILKAQELPSLDPIFAARLLWAQANFALQAGEAERAWELADKLGLIREWMILGPFNNKHGNFEYPVGDGLGREWPLVLDKPRKGIKGVLHWRQVGTLEPLGFVNLRVGLRPNEECLAYAICAVQVKRDTEVALRLGSDDMIAAWCNGQRQLFLDGRRDAGFDQDAVSFTLQRGWNILVIQSGNLKEEWGFYARLTRPDGTPLPDLRITADPKQVETALNSLTAQAAQEKGEGKKSPAQIQSLPKPFQGAISAFEKKLEESPADVRTNYYLGWLLMTRKSLLPTDRRDLKYLLQASKGDLKNSVYYLAFAEASVDYSRHAADRDENARRMSLQYAMQLGEQEVEARTRLANYYLYSMRNLVRAEQLAEDAARTNPLGLGAQLTLYDIYKLRGWSALATKTLGKMLLRYPNSRELLQRAGMDALDREANLEAEEYYQRLLGLDHTSDYAVQGLVEAKQRLGNPPEMDRLRKLLAIKPYDIFLRRSLIEAHTRVRDYPGALAVIEEALMIVPEDAAMLEWKGQVLVQLGRSQEALEAWDQALALKPSLLSLKNRVQFLRNRKDSLCTPVADLREFVLQHQDYPTRRGDSRLYLLRETADRINNDGTRSQALHQVVKILDQQASRDLAVIKLGVEEEYESLQLITARVMRADGTIEPVRHNDNSGFDWGKEIYQELSFAPLNVGDVIEIAYRRDYSRQNFFGDYFGEIFRFRNYYPTAISRYILESPLSREIHIHQSPEVPEPQVTEDANRAVKRQEWEMRELAGIELEPYMPPLSELSPRVQVSSFKNWDDFARWYWQLVREQYLADEDIHNKVMEITEGIEDPQAQLAAIHRWVSEKIQNVAWEFGIHGYKPYKTSTVFSRGFGDCKDKTALICVMARELGFQAWPVLLWGYDENADVLAGFSTGRGREDFTLPLLNHFNHSISAVWVDGHWVWLDGTITSGNVDVINNVPPLDAGAKAVVVTPEGARREDIPTRKAEDNQWAETSELVFLASGEATLNQSVSLRGDVAVDLGSYIANRELFRLVLELLAKRQLGPISVEKAVLEEPETEGIEAIDITARIMIDRAAKVSGDTMHFCLPPAWLRGKPQVSPLPERLSIYAAESVRAHDLLLPRAFLIKSEIRVSPPSGWRLSWLPSAVTIEEPFGLLQAEVELEGEVLVVRRTLRIDANRISRRDYHAFRRFCFRADEIEKLEFVLEKIK